MSMTVAERQRNLDVANERRLAMAKIKANIKAPELWDGRRLVANLLDAPTEHVEAFQIGPLMLCIHRFGERGVKRILHIAGVSYDRRVRDLTPRQRGEVSRLLRAGKASPLHAGRPKSSQLLPLEPFRVWLVRTLHEHQLKDIADLAGVSERRLRAVLNREQRHITLDVVDRCLTAIGDHLGEVYPYEESAA